MTSFLLSVPHALGGHEHKMVRSSKLRCHLEEGVVAVNGSGREEDGECNWFLAERAAEVRTGEMLEINEI